MSSPRRENDFRLPCNYKPLSKSGPQFPNKPIINLHSLDIYRQYYMWKLLCQTLTLCINYLVVFFSTQSLIISGSPNAPKFPLSGYQLEHFPPHFITRQ